MKLILKKTVAFPSIYFLGCITMLFLVFGDPNDVSEWFFQKGQGIYEWSEK